MLAVHLNILCLHTKFQKNEEKMCGLCKKHKTMSRKNSIRSTENYFVTQANKKCIFPPNFVCGYKVFRCTLFGDFLTL